MFRTMKVRIGMKLMLIQPGKARSGRLRIYIGFSIGIMMSITYSRNSRI